MTRRSKRSSSTRRVITSSPIVSKEFRFDVPEIVELECLGDVVQGLGNFCAVEQIKTAHIAAKEHAITKQAESVEWQVELSGVDLLRKGDVLDLGRSASHGGLDYEAKAQEDRCENRGGHGAGRD